MCTVHDKDDNKLATTFVSGFYILKNADNKRQ